MDKYLAIVILGIVWLMSKMAAFTSLHRCGRRPLTLMSGMCMSILCKAKTCRFNRTFLSQYFVHTAIGCALTKIGLGNIDFCGLHLHFPNCLYTCGMSHDWWSPPNTVKRFTSTDLHTIHFTLMLKVKFHVYWPICANLLATFTVKEFLWHVETSKDVS